MLTNVGDTKIFMDSLASDNMSIQTIEEINEVLEPETGWRVELAVSPHDHSEFLRLYRKAGATWNDKVFVWSFPRDSSAHVLAACGGAARHYFELGQATPASTPD